jgi:hypothetical protein
MSIINSEGRFILVEKTLAYPHCDIVTKDTHGPFFDLSVDLDNFEGVPYVKAAHVEEMAKTLGMATKEEVAILNERIRILEAENTRLPGESEELVNGINNLVAVYHRNIRSAGDVRTELFGSSTIEDLGESDDDSSGGNESSDIESSGKSGSSFGPNDRDDFEVFDRIVEPNGQADSNAGDKGPNSIPASSSDEFGLG